MNVITHVLMLAAFICFVGVCFSLDRSEARFLQAKRAPMAWKPEIGAAYYKRAAKWNLAAFIFLVLLLIDVPALIYCLNWENAHGYSYIIFSRLAPK